MSKEVDSTKDLHLEELQGDLYGHLTHEEFLEIIENSESPFTIILETGGLKFAFLGYSNLYNAYRLGKL